MAESNEAMGIEAEFEGAELGDRRRLSRLVRLVRALDERPEASYPDATVTDAGLEGAYRLLSNEAVSADAILAGHYAQTAERAGAEEWVIAVHDTTIFEFSGEKEREGLGPLRGKGQGFLGHFTLTVAPGELRRPLGVIGLQAVVRKRRRGQAKRRPAAGESARWLRGVELAERRLHHPAVIHVMDREADSYDLWSSLIQTERRFVVRSRWDRPLAGEDALQMSDVLARATTIVERTVALSPRRQQKIVFNRKRRPARAGRLARLALSAAKVVIRRPIKAESDVAETLQINVVYVREVETNGENPPVEWTLATTEPIETAADVERIVDIYRARWVIEEYFKAIKSGCAYEKRQLESMHTLLNGLAVFIPIAWRLLLLRTLARDAASEPATSALTQTQLDVLIAIKKTPLPNNPTVRDAMLAVARLGGHIKNNGEPGWAVLGRGFHKLLALEEGWIAALNARSDQS
jgi:hypothetical protein